MSDAQYVQYTNLHIFAKKWRGYKQVSTSMNKDEFRKDMQFNQYVKLDYTHPLNGRLIHIYLLAKNSKYSNSSQDLKILLAKVRDPSDVILVVESEFNIYSKRKIALYKHLRVKTYLHDNFKLIIPNGPLCYPHRILSTEEVNQLLNNDLCCSLINLPKILLEDVQCIWIGAEVGDVIEINMMSDISGNSIVYKVVVAKSGRVISFRDYDKKNPVINNEAELEDDEVIAHRENNVSDNDED
jgi:DNA-directed RNA polymerase subunit H (RpoH/RPB5)